MASVYTLSTSSSASVDLSQITSATKPTTRVDGSALVVSDRWINTTDFVICFWNGTYWLSSFLIVDNAPEYSSGAGNAYQNTFAVINQTVGLSVFIESLTVAYTSYGANPLTDFQIITLTGLQNRVSTRTTIGSVSTANATAVRTATTSINQAFTVGFTSPAISMLSIDSIYGGGAGANSFWQGSVAYRRIY